MNVGDFFGAYTQRAWLAWEDPNNEPPPLPRWKRYCSDEFKPQLLVGVTVALARVEWQTVCYVHGCYARECGCEVTRCA